MENKYFTPDIEDIRVGYECEANPKLYGSVEDVWKPTIMKGVGQEVIYYHSLGVYRTPYVTQEQIEAEGWKFSSKWEPVIFFKKGDWILKYWYKLHIIELHTNDLVREIDKFNANFDRATTLNCECKSINELRIIQKMLRI